jgi:hypothetical protein
MPYSLAWSPICQEVANFVQYGEPVNNEAHVSHMGLFCFGVLGREARIAMTEESDGDSAEYHLGHQMLSISDFAYTQGPPALLLLGT